MYSFAFQSNHSNFRIFSYHCYFLRSNILQLIALVSQHENRLSNLKFVFDSKLGKLSVFKMLLWKSKIERMRGDFHQIPFNSMQFAITENDKSI